jgi:hypothetical protein
MFLTFRTEDGDCRSVRLNPRGGQGRRAPAAASLPLTPLRYLS